jgi:hypothetical protein
VFHVTYDASKQTWSGTLTIGDQTFSGEKSAVFGLLRDLDTKFRDSLQPPAAAAPSATPAEPMPGA